MGPRRSADLVDHISRRELLATAAKCVVGGVGMLAASGEPLQSLLGGAEVWAAASRLDTILKSAPVARYWTSVALAGSDCTACHKGATDIAGKRAAHDPALVKCLLCAQGCAIKPGQRGKCRARMNVKGELRSLVYGRPLAVHIDPIEKKPFYHFLPGSAALSLGTSGCPLRCKFCQNWELSQASPEDHDTSFTTAAGLAGSASANRAPVIAFTYNEATVFAEYLLDVAREGRKQRLRSVLVSCGFMNEAPLADMCAALDAIKIDLKGYSEEFYRTVCGAELQPVLRSIKQVHKSGVHLEIVNLVVPTLNDSEKQLEQLCQWIAGELGPDVPVHFTRFHPDYQLLNLPPTPIATLERARDIAGAKGIHYAYVGNVPGHPGNHTYCPSCTKPVIKRNDFFVTEMHLKAGRCQYCGQPIAGVWT
ncbi:MAG: AmmeMemoRadiSam system radical SAM enzyme [Acidobacteriota bacterium]